MENYLKQITLMAQKYKYFVIFLLIGVCFMVLCAPSKQETVVSINENFDIEEIESKLEEILSKIDKVGDVSVMITTESGTENVYATNISESVSQADNQIKRDTLTEYVMISPSSGSEQPVKIYDIYPKFRGVLVVCQGADNNQVKLEILQAIKSLCGLSSENITISKMKE